MDNRAMVIINGQRPATSPMRASCMVRDTPTPLMAIVPMMIPAAAETAISGSIAAPVC